MTDKTVLFTEEKMTPEGIIANGSFSRREKLARLQDMKEDLARQATRDDAMSLDEAEHRMAELDIAIARVRRQPGAAGDGLATGRMPSA